MGKAARQRRRRRVKYLVNLSFCAPEQFSESWERRIDSWLIQVRRLGRMWAMGKVQKNDMKIFDYIGEAMHILSQCDEPVRKAYECYTYDVLCHECSMQVAKITDRRLYNTSNLHKVMQLSAFYQSPKKRSLNNE